MTATLVIGAGVVGLATAYELLKAGHEVTVIEKDSYGLGPSFGNAALVTGVLSFPVPAPGAVALAARSLVQGNQAITIRPQFTPSFASYLLKMAWATRPARFAVGTHAQDLLSVMVNGTYDELVAEGLKFEHHARGSMHVFDSRQHWEAAVAVFDDFPDIKARIQVLDGAAAVHDIDPNLAPEIEYGYYAKTDLQVEPMSLMTALVAAIREKGGTLVEHCEVLEFARTGDRVDSVVTTEGSFQAEQVVIAAGVESRVLAGRLGFSLPMFSGGGYSIDVHFADDALKPSASVLTDVSHIAVTPLERGLRASSGMIIGQPAPTVNPAAIEKLKRDLHLVYPNVPLDEVTSGWAGLRPMPSDGVPVIGLVPGLSNAYLATGHAMLGLSYAPATAKVLRALIQGTAPSSYELLSPRRFNR